MIKGYQPVMSFDEDYARRDRDFQRGDEMAAVAFLEQLVGSGSGSSVAKRGKNEEEAKDLFFAVKGYQAG
jgi:hypothetical protein